MSFGPLEEVCWSGLEAGSPSSELRDLPIILITAKIDETLIENNMSKNIFGFLYKPLHKNNFNQPLAMNRQLERVTINFTLSLFRSTQKFFIYITLAN